MNLKFYPLRAVLFSLLLLGFKARTQAQAALEFVKTVENSTTGGDGTIASQGEILTYTISVRNLTAQNYVAAKLYDNLPAGVAYITGSTTLNGGAVADKTGGVMPYTGNGQYINSPGYGTGILAPGGAPVTAVIRFRVRVTANGGRIFNNATIDATQNSLSTIQATNTVYTDITVDAGCNIVYQTTTFYPDHTAGSNLSPAQPELDEWSFLRELNTSNGTATATPLYNGITGARREHNSTTNIAARLMDNCAAIAYDRPNRKIYFVNNYASPEQRLMYVDLNQAGPPPYIARRYNSTSILEPANGDNGYRINRMGMGSDGYCYALTSNGRDLIRFQVSGTSQPVIQRLGALTNAASNASSGRNILSESGGDLFADGSGKLYLIANSSNMYKINPANRVATYMGRVNPFPGTSQSLAIDALGNVYIGGAYNDVYRLNLQTMAATRINSNSTDVYHSGDFTSCGFPVLASSITANKTYRNINGSPTVNGGDTVEYVITVTNMGNINAAGVYMYDYIPPSTQYLAGTTRLNGILVPDAAGGVMPYAVSGGRLVNTPGEDPGIVRPTAANSAVVTFRVVTQPNVQVCNQSRITLLDGDVNVMFVNSNDPTNVGQTPTCFYSDGVLPLTNLKFKGSLSENRSVLNWNMNGDENVATYEVEYSENGTSFSTTGKVPGKGTNSANSYQFTDVEHTFASIRYYRLKVIQKGGNYTYSGIIRLNADDLSVEAVPNPFDRDINVQIKLKTAETVRIRLIDLLGKEVYNTTEQLGIGSHSLSIHIPAGLAKGMYVLDIKAGTEQLFQKKLLKR